MPYPDVGARGYDYEAFSEGQGDNSFPGTNVNNDLDNLFAHGAAVDDFLAVAHDNTGAIKPGHVTRTMLSPGIQMGIEPPAPWLTATNYSAGESVTINNNLYVCEITHDSGVFATDLAAGRWALVAAFAIPSTPPADSVNTAAIQNNAVTSAKIADDAVGTSEIANSAVTRPKLALNVGIGLFGEERGFAGITLPAGWLFCAGQAVARSTYADLFAALTTTLSATRELGSATLTVATDLRGLGLVGAVVEGTGIPSGSVIASLTATTIVLDQPASSTGTANIIVAPHGLGNGSTTFNVPDRRGRVLVGRDDMGGTAASRMTGTTVDATRLAAAGGAQTHTLTEAQLPAHTHTIADHNHGVTDAGHTHTAYGGTATTSADAVAARAATSRGFAGHTSSTGLATFTNFPNSGVQALGNATTGLTVNNAALSPASVGSGAAHNNVQPSGVTNIIIFAGV
jgi:microcystin-dependent protein